MIARREPTQKSRPPGGTDLLLGYGRSVRTGIGFGAASATTDARDPIVYNGDGHLITIAPTRSGKGVSAVIPALLRYQGTTVVLDVKGEAFSVTAQRRRQMGHRVVRLAPFDTRADVVDAFNPFDVFSLLGCDLETETQSMAALFAKGNQGTKEPYWDVAGTGVLAGGIAYAGSQADPAKRNLVTVIEKFFNDDVVYNWAVTLDNEGKKLPPLTYREISSFLSTTDVTRSGILATAQAYLKPFLAPGLARSLTTSTFPIQELVDGGPLTIYIEVPPTKLYSHRALLKLWIGAMLTAVLCRTARPALRTLFLLDEIMQLENFPHLESLVTLSGGYGVWAWLICQDLAQLAANYPQSWKTILNNCSVLQAFGFNNRDMAQQWSGYLDHSPAELRAMGAKEQVLSIQGQGEFICRRPNYLVDGEFHGLYQENRFYARDQNDRERPNDQVFTPIDRHSGGGNARNN